MRIVEFRIILPLTVEEYHVGQLWSVAEASRNETGGGEGIEVLVNEPFNPETHPPETPLLGGDPQYTTGQYTHKRYHLKHKVPGFVRLLAPKGSLEMDERAWNAFPYCRTVIDNPGYMKKNFYITIESMHCQDAGTCDNVHNLSSEELAKREVIFIDIADNSMINRSDYKEESDCTKFHSEKTGRGPLTTTSWWKNSPQPIMCAYKLVKCHFKWFGLQTRIEEFIMRQERRIFTLFHRQVFCWIDKWHGLTMADVRKIEEKLKEELIEQLRYGEARGYAADEQ